MNSYSELSAKDFLEALIDDRKSESAPWIKCIVRNPAVLDEAWNKRIYSQNGHVIIAQRKTRDSHCFGPILVYLRNICRECKVDDTKYKLYDSKGEYEHVFQLEKDGHKYFVEWQGTEGLYSIKVDEAAEPAVYDPEDMINHMYKTITNS